MTQPEQPPRFAPNPRTLVFCDPGKHVVKQGEPGAGKWFGGRFICAACIRANAPPEAGK